MNIPDVTGYSGSLPRAYADGTSSDGSTPTAAKKKSSLDMSDFLKLMAAQYQCQSIDSTVDNTEYITQMAMFSAVQAMNQLTQNSDKQFASALVGKPVTVSTGSQTNPTVSGIVQNATLDSSGNSKIVIDGNSYDVSDVVSTSNDDSELMIGLREYASSLIGYTVTVDDASNHATVTGTVQSAVYGTDGSCKVMINGKEYDPVDITSVQLVAGKS